MEPSDDEDDDEDEEDEAFAESAKNWLSDLNWANACSM